MHLLFFSRSPTYNDAYTYSRQQDLRRDKALRITKEQAEENRAQVLNTATKLFLEKGYDGIAVAELMQAAGFTHGGFYNHFNSKETLARAATVNAFQKRATAMAKAEDLEGHLRLYISDLHIDRPDEGCPAAALSSDAARASPELKSIFADGIEAMIVSLEKRLQSEGMRAPRTRRQLAITLLTKMTGTIGLARAVPANHKLRSEILETGLKGALKEAATAISASKNT